MFIFIPSEKITQEKYKKKKNNNKKPHETKVQDQPWQMDKVLLGI